MLNMKEIHDIFFYLHPARQFGLFWQMRAYRFAACWEAGHASPFAR
jgi:hypothetical protein